MSVVVVVGAALAGNAEPAAGAVAAGGGSGGDIDGGAKGESGSTSVVLTSGPLSEECRARGGDLEFSGDTPSDTRR